MINWTGASGLIHISYFIAQIQQSCKKEIFRGILDWVDEIFTTTRMGMGTMGAEGVHFLSALNFSCFHLPSFTFFLLFLLFLLTLSAYPVLVTNVPFIFTMSFESGGRGRQAADAEMHIRSPSEGGKGEGEGAPFDLGTDRPLCLSLSFPLLYPSQLNKNFRPIWVGDSRAG